MSLLTSIQIKPLNIPRGILLALAAVVSFHLASQFAACAWCMVVFLYCLFRLCALGSARQAFWFGFGVGLAVYSPHLGFFWTIFGPAAISLWCILSFWLGLFVLLGRASLIRFRSVGWALLAPFVWTGLEYFRSELYYLRFSWLNAGYDFSYSPALHYMAGFGVYGIGFLFMAWAAFIAVAPRLSTLTRRAAATVLAGLLTLPFWFPIHATSSAQHVNVTGIQLEVTSVPQIQSALNGALKKYPQTDLFVLSEYALHSPVPPQLLRWCKEHGKWLAMGGEDPVAHSNYYNTVFVASPDGAIAFQQAKCVPVQFMKDGLPAFQQRLWDSPWGRLGFGICYDASYTRVTDELIRQGAQALIFPTMDMSDWGRAEHELHGRIAPMRAAEYAVPVFRLCSSGISQFAGRSGRVIASAPFPGQGAMLNAQIQLPPRGRIPLDRPLAMFSAVLSAALMIYLVLYQCLGPRRPPKIPE
jgi:apolipoprotein N-acyltransferase